MRSYEDCKSQFATMFEEFKAFPMVAIDKTGDFSTSVDDAMQAVLNCICSDDGGDKKPRAQLNILFVGDAEVGKSSIVRHFTGHDHEEHYSPTTILQTTAVDGFVLNGVKHNLKILDCSGQELYKKNLESQLQSDFAAPPDRPHIAAIVCSATDENWKQSLEKWMQFIEKNYVPMFPTYLIINKWDIRDREAHPTKAQWHHEYYAFRGSKTNGKNRSNLQECFFTSAKTKKDIVKATSEIVRCAIERQKVEASAAK